MIAGALIAGDAAPRTAGTALFTMDRVQLSDDRE